MKIIHKFFLLIIPIFLFSLGTLLVLLHRFADTPFVLHTTTYELKNGRGMFDVANNLYKQGAISHKKLLILLTQLLGQSRHLQAGEYLFTQGSTPRQLINQIAWGKAIQHSITFPEGWTFLQMQEAIKNNKFLKQSLVGYSTLDIIAKIAPGYSQPEGLFYPSTYYFKKGTTDFAILKLAHQKMMQLLHQAWQTRQANLPYKNIYQALIMASLIEKESSFESERPLIAGVLLQRLAINMPLQCDPTLVYALGNHFKGELTHQDLQLNSPYNSYKNRGLPPTPIAMPSFNSIQAALHPVMKGYLYFVANGEGSHVFSKTFAEHLKNVAKLRQLQESNRNSN